MRPGKYRLVFSALNDAGECRNHLAVVFAWRGRCIPRTSNLTDRLFVSGIDRILNLGGGF